MKTQDQNDEPCGNEKRRLTFRVASANFDDVLIRVGTTAAIVLMVLLLVVSGFYLDGA
jgi:hypothetical protein